MLKCKKCGYQWYRRKESMPIRCPNYRCGTIDWNSDKWKRKQPLRKAGK